MAPPGGAGWWPPVAWRLFQLLTLAGVVWAGWRLLGHVTYRIDIDDRTRARLIEEHVGQPVEFAAFLAEWDRLCTERFAKGIPIKAGAVELLESLEAAGVPVALATSSRRGPAEEKLAAIGLGHHFRTVVTFDDVAAPKPAPDPYLLAAERLGVAPNTVAKAYRALEQEGYLVTAGRNGTQVADQRVATTERTRQQLRAVLQPLLDGGMTPAEVHRLVRSILST